jgi:hypothetical protein
MEASSLRRADFGPLVLSPDIDDATIATLREWFPTYMERHAEERDLDLTQIQLPKSGQFAAVIDDEQFPDYNLPSIIVTTAQTEGEPTQDGNGNYFAAWNVVVSAIVRGRNALETRQLAGHFEGCVRRILVQQGIDLPGEVKWRGSNVAPVMDPTNSGRFIAAGMGNYLAYVDEVVQEGVGPNKDSNPYPPADPEDPSTPYEPLISVGRVNFDLQNRT